MKVAIDSNALTYLIDAMKPDYMPLSDGPDLGLERISMLRIFLYGGLSFYVLPQVMYEYQQIPEIEKRDIHQFTVDILLIETPMESCSNKVSQRKGELLLTHPKDKDCQILAEAEILGISTLLTRDTNFIKRLASCTSVRILRPSKFWKSLNVVPGSEPIYGPTESNPLFGKTWWKI